MSTAAVDHHHQLTNLPAKACHNCRRSRLRCDKSLPGCEKCHSKGTRCLGYGNLLRWTTNVTARGPRSTSPPPTRPPPDEVDKYAVVLRLDGSTIPYKTIPKNPANHVVSAPFSLVDPALQDLDTRSRFYISHFTHSVCQDLVSFDQLDHTNPFRYMTALLGDFDYLREIILATSAVHMVTLRRCRRLPHQQELVDALAAKGRATRLLRRALEQLSPADKPIVIIAVAFFINFDLIDSGRGHWKTHIEAAGSLIASIQGLSRNLSPSFVQLADSVVADCITYHILGAGFASPADPAMSAFDSVDIVATLQRGAAFSYGCSPPVVLNALLGASRLSPDDVPGAVALLEDLRGCDTRRWVYEIPGLSPKDDLEVRVSMADAHRVATILYVALAVPGSLSCLRQPTATTASVLSELVCHLAAVPLAHALAKGAIWPTFMAGAQASDESTRQWCFGRMQVIWHSTPWICPWGYVEAAIDMLQKVWELRDTDDTSGDAARVVNWLQNMRGMRDHCLIV